MDDVLVTFNTTTVATAVVGGLLFGFLVVNESVETVLERWLVEVRIHLLLKLVPLLLLLIGVPLVLTFYLSAILTDLFTSSPNNVLRAFGRGLGHLTFLAAVSVGAWLDYRYRRSPPGDPPV